MFLNSARRGIYQHYKGKLYSAELGAKMEGSGKLYVVYRELDSEKYWVRPKDEFEEILELEVPKSVKNNFHEPEYKTVEVPRYSWIRPSPDDPSSSPLF